MRTLFDMSTVGHFLVEKLQNMHNWLSEECQGYDKHKYDLCRSILTPTNATIVAEILLRHKSTIYQRDWDNLSRIPQLPVEIVELGVLIKPQPKLHDKFWRYLELFVESVSSD